MTAPRVWVTALLVLLCVPGVIGFDLWPLTGWRLFSLSRDATQTEWALDVLGSNGPREVDLEELPVAFRNAAWPLADFPRRTERRRDEVCRALLDGVRSVVPDATRLGVVRERRTMEADGIHEDRERFHECTAAP